ncbi:16S rRNA (cytosine(967)-C(5))-methyltransferase RsmB [Paenibacillus pasadenensis]|uniref:16S rRNA (cytosine(967)-C(5))-methyltransferase RsmB n=1 Tax=Paenibacillus pasadenensis TaxID=217090 RepID=UPI002042386A|nr:16S rRNA (cytosine(967)-C(5))-methyltransferase RsmB [Paenibacillus pasadenensis]MCM3746146.1 16S rRNA (cytosine(967)-C(5))-methyltransferase RsmB [Paenibacillus pasadenensis]
MSGRREPGAAGAGKGAAGRPGMAGGTQSRRGGAAGGKDAARGRTAGAGAPKARQPRSARELALDALVRVDRDGAYSNLQLNAALQESGLSRADAGLATELVYGTLQRRLTLDYWLQQFIAKGFAKLEPWVLSLLRMSLYQLVYLDRVPPHAAVNEAVTIGRRRGHAGISGMLNGVLRNAVRQLPQLKAETFGGEKNDVRRLSLRHSYPEWITERWVADYGVETAELMMAAGNEPPRSSLRVNRLRISPEQALLQLEQAGFHASLSEAAPWAGVVVARGGNLTATDGYTEGLWSIQDESSMIVAAAANPRPGFRVLDCCAAPGGKSAHMAELMDGHGEIIANDLHPHKRALIESQAARLGLDVIKAVSGDAAELPEHFAHASFDLVLLDAPCSGLGVIRRKPEIKWTKTPDDIVAIAAIQEKLLDAAALLVKPGGTLLYSTCTIAGEENAGQIDAFLSRNPEFAPDPEGWPAEVLAPLQAAGAAADGSGHFGGTLQLLPHHFGSDGFYIARLKRR